MNIDLRTVLYGELPMRKPLVIEGGTSGKSRRDGGITVGSPVAGVGAVDTGKPLPQAGYPRWLGLSDSFKL